MRAMNDTRSAQEKVLDLVSYHKPDDEAVAKIGRLRAAVQSLILELLECCPPGADRSAAIRKARECLMTGNAAIVVPPVSL